MDEIVKLIIANTERIISIVAIIASYFIGVYSNRRNDKRKEFNAVVDPAILAMLKMIDDHASGVLPKRNPITKGDILKISIHLSAAQSKRLVYQYDSFNDCCRKIKRTMYGAPVINEDDLAIIMKEASVMLKILRRK